MEMINDPDMREIVIEFCDESTTLLEGLLELLEKMKKSGTSSSQLEEFGQVIDRIMGAAKSLGAHKIANICELGKLIGYKSSQVSDNEKLLEVVITVLSDGVHIFKKMIYSIKNESAENIDSLNVDKYVEKLTYLSSQFNDIERSSISFEQSKKTETKIKMSNDDVERLLTKNT